MADSSTIRIPPYCYIHVLDKNSNITRLEIGPQTYVKQDQEQIVTGATPQKMVVIPPYNYCEILDPVYRDSQRNPIMDNNNQAKIKYGEKEYRFRDQFPEPFPLYPKERLSKIAPLSSITDGTYLKIEALRDFVDEKGVKRIAGDQWIVKGPCTYYPRVEEDLLQIENKYIIKQGQAVRLKAIREFIDDESGIKRTTGEEWILSKPGSYIKNVYEEIVQWQESYVITKEKALHLRAIKNFEDAYQNERKAGDEWLITDDVSTSHILGVFEEVVGTVKRTVLDATQYVVIKDPYDPVAKKNRLGVEIIKAGEDSFFLQPGESMSGGIQKLYILGENEAILLKAKESYFQQRVPDRILQEEIAALVKAKKDSEILLLKNKKTENIRVAVKGKAEVKDYEEIINLKDGLALHEFLQPIEHQPGDRWMEYGPLSYLPPCEVEVIKVITEIPLDKNEGIYVRDNRKGEVRAVIGETYMLKPNEELFSLELPDAVEKLLAKEKESSAPRDKTRVVTYRCPYNSAVQIYDYKAKENRIVFGPELIMLQPDEVFTVFVLSGGKPKRPGLIQTLYLMLGPDFSTDVCEVETSDHAKLRLQLSYNWKFKFDKNNKEEAQKMFTIKDFVGDLCNIMAAKVRAAVAGVSFENFHKSSARLIRTSIFGVDENGKIKDELAFSKNNLILTNVDIQLVEPIDVRTKQSLKETVSLAIEITTKTQEEEALRIAEKADQENEGQLNKIKIDDESKAEESRKKLLTLQIECERIKNTGEANAQANAQSKAELYKAKSKLEISKLKADAKKLVTEASISKDEEIQKVEIEYEQKMSDVQIKKNKELAEIEAKKFEDIMQALGQETLIAIASSGPDLQAKLLEGLGLKGFLLTDGKSPINLFNAAQGLVGGQPQI